MRSTRVSALAAKGLLAVGALLHGTGATRAEPPRPAAAVSVLVPKAGDPAPVLLRVALPQPAADKESPTAAILPGTVTDPDPKRCPLADTGRLAPAIAGRVDSGDPGFALVTLTIGRAACGGPHGFVLRTGVSDSSGKPVGGVRDSDISLNVRFEPTLDVTSGPLELQQVTCLLCWMPPLLSRALLPAGFPTARTLDVKNTSAGVVKVRPLLSAQDYTPKDVVDTLQLEFADTSGDPGEFDLLPQESRQLRVLARERTGAPAGAQAVRLTLTASEAEAPDAIVRIVSVPIRLSLRLPALYSVIALLLGFIAGRLLLLTQDPDYAAMLDAYGRLRDARERAASIPDAAERLRILGEIEKLDWDLDSSRKLTKALQDQLDTLDAEIVAAIVPEANAGNLRDARVEAPNPRLAGPDKRSRAARWIDAIIDERPPPVAQGYQSRRLLKILVALGMMLVGLNTYFTAAIGATLGAGGLADYVPLFVWGATALAAAKTFDALKR